jgi:hypothetical protein
VKEQKKYILNPHKKGIERSFAVEVKDNLLKVSEVLALTKNACGVSVEGLVSDLKENTTKKGDFYVSGVLVTKDGSLPFKKWDCSLEEFTKMLPLNSTESIVKLKGDADIYEGKVQFIVKNLLPSESPVEDFIRVPSTPLKDLLESLFNALMVAGNVGGNAENDTFTQFLINLIGFYERNTCEKPTENLSQRLAYVPFSPTVHNERSGYLAHIVNVLSSLGVGWSDKETVNVGLSEDVNLGVMIISLLIYRLPSLGRYDFSIVTGVIKSVNKEEEELFGKTNVIDFFNSFCKQASTELGAKEGKKFNFKDKKLLNIKHCLLALNKVVEPVTPEALCICQKVDFELSLEKFKGEYNHIL